jgi:hypothetical protein
LASKLGQLYAGGDKSPIKMIDADKTFNLASPTRKRPSLSKGIASAIKNKLVMNDTGEVLSPSLKRGTSLTKSGMKGSLLKQTLGTHFTGRLTKKQT